MSITQPLCKFNCRFFEKLKKIHENDIQSSLWKNMKNVGDENYT